ELLITSLPNINTFERRYDDSAYDVEKLSAHDDDDRLLRYKKMLHRFSPLFVFLAMSSYFVYFGFRIYYTLEAQRAFNK
ncbi:hypothetical protein H2201_009095, partial [Coniosporium apollinis]